jgi:hypothetical protein
MPRIEDRHAFGRGIKSGANSFLISASDGLFCWREAAEAYKECHAKFVICARTTPRLIEILRQAE